MDARLRFMGGPDLVSTRFLDHAWLYGNKGHRTYMCHGHANQDSIADRPPATESPKLALGKYVSEDSTWIATTVLDVDDPCQATKCSDRCQKSHRGT